MFALISWITTLTFLLGVIFIIIRMKENEEDYYWLKIIGYYFLGTFRFSFNKLHIPLGFIIFLAFLRNTQNNNKSKKYAAGLGVAAFIVSLAIPAIAESYFERPRYIESASKNIYEFNFQNHWKQVTSKLKLGDNSIQTAKVEHLDIHYEKDGEIRTFRYELVWREEGQLHHAWVDFNISQKKFRIRVTKISEWLQYNRLLGAQRLFKKLDSLNIKNLTPEVEASYYGFTLGERVNFGISDAQIFIIDNGKVEPFTGKLPVECYWIRTYGMKQTGKSSYTSTDVNYYLFDVSQR